MERDRGGVGGNALIDTAAAAGSQTRIEVSAGDIELRGPRGPEQPACPGTAWLVGSGAHTSIGVIIPALARGIAAIYPEITPESVEIGQLGRI